MYGRAYAKYVLLRLELGACELDRAHYFSARSIEHVFPQNPADDSDWVDSLDDEEILIDFVHSVGNLVLLSKSKNSSANNFEFTAKKDRYLKARVSDYPRSIEVLGHDKWDTKVMSQRELKKQVI